MGYENRIPKGYIQKLDAIYYKFGDSGGFSSPQAVLKQFRKLHPRLIITKNQVLDYLTHQTTYTLHRKKINKFQRNMVFTPRCMYQWSIDLAEMGGFEQYNHGVRFFLLCCDTLTRFIYTEPVKSKSASCVSNALQNIFNRADTLPKLINADSGGEFCNSKVQTLLKNNNIHFFKSYGVVKASHAEIGIKSIKNLIYRYFDYTLDREWLSVLQPATDTYNKSFHSGIKMTPETACTYPFWVKLSEKSLHRAVEQIRQREIPYLKKGDAVRISLDISFKKGFEPNWSRAIYLIDTHPYYTVGGKYPMYSIKEQNSDSILGGFYAHQLQRVSKRTFIDEYKFPIEKVVKKGSKSSLVKFLGYDDKYNLWLPNKDIKNIKSIKL